MSKTNAFYEDATGAALEIQRELREAQERLNEYQRYYGIDSYAMGEIAGPIDRAYKAAEFIEQAGASTSSHRNAETRGHFPYPKR